MWGPLSAKKKEKEIRIWAVDKVQREEARPARGIDVIKEEDIEEFEKVLSEAKLKFGIKEALAMPLRGKR